MAVSMKYSKLHPDSDVIVINPDGFGTVIFHGLFRDENDAPQALKGWGEIHFRKKTDTAWITAGKNYKSIVGNLDKQYERVQCDIPMEDGVVYEVKLYSPPNIDNYESQPYEVTAIARKQEGPVVTAVMTVTPETNNVNNWGSQSTIIVKATDENGPVKGITNWVFDVISPLVPQQVKKSFLGEVADGEYKWVVTSEGVPKDYTWKLAGTSVMKTLTFSATIPNRMEGNATVALNRVDVPDTEERPFPEHPKDNGDTDPVEEDKPNPNHRWVRNYDNKIILFVMDNDEIDYTIFLEGEEGYTAPPKDFFKTTNDVEIDPELRPIWDENNASLRAVATGTELFRDERGWFPPAYDLTETITGYSKTTIEAVEEIGVTKINDWVTNVDLGSAVKFKITLRDDNNELVTNASEEVLLAVASAGMNLDTSYNKVKEVSPGVYETFYRFTVVDDYWVGYNFSGKAAPKMRYRVRPRADGKGTFDLEKSELIASPNFDMPVGTTGSVSVKICLHNGELLLSKGSDDYDTGRLFELWTRKKGETKWEKDTYSNFNPSNENSEFWATEVYKDQPGEFEYDVRYSGSGFDKPVSLKYINPVKPTLWNDDVSELWVDPRYDLFMLGTRVIISVLFQDNNGEVIRPNRKDFRLINYATGEPSYCNDFIMSVKGNGAVWMSGRLGEEISEYVTFEYKGQKSNKLLRIYSRNIDALLYDKNAADFRLDQDVVGVSEAVSGSVRLEINYMPITGKENELTLTDMDGNNPGFGNVKFSEMPAGSGSYRFSTTAFKAFDEKDITFSVKNVPHPEGHKLTVNEGEFPKGWWDNVTNDFEYIHEDPEAVFERDDVSCFVVGLGKGKFVAKLTDGTVEKKPVTGKAKELKLIRMGNNAGYSVYNKFECKETEPGTYVWEVETTDYVREVIAVGDHLLYSFNPYQIVFTESNEEFDLGYNSSFSTIPENMNPIMIGQDYTFVVKLTKSGEDGDTIPYTGMADQLRVLTDNGYFQNQESKMVESATEPGTYTGTGVTKFASKDYVSPYVGNRPFGGTNVIVASDRKLSLENTTITLLTPPEQVVKDKPFTLEVVFKDTNNEELSPEDFLPQTFFFDTEDEAVDFRWVKSAYGDHISGGKYHYVFQSYQAVEANLILKGDNIKVEKDNAVIEPVIGKTTTVNILDEEGPTKEGLDDSKTVYEITPNVSNHPARPIDFKVSLFNYDDTPVTGLKDLKLQFEGLDEMDDVALVESKTKPGQYEGNHDGLRRSLSENAIHKCRAYQDSGFKSEVFGEFTIKELFNEEKTFVQFIYDASSINVGSEGEVEVVLKDDEGKNIEEVDTVWLVHVRGDLNYLDNLDLHMVGSKTYRRPMNFEEMGLGYFKLKTADQISEKEYELKVVAAKPKSFDVEQTLFEIIPDTTTYAGELRTVRIKLIGTDGEEIPYSYSGDEPVLCTVDNNGNVLEEFNEYGWSMNTLDWSSWENVVVTLVGEHNYTFKYKDTVYPYFYTIEGVKYPMPGGFDPKYSRIYSEPRLDFPKVGDAVSIGITVYNKQGNAVRINKGDIELVLPVTGERSPLHRDDFRPSGGNSIFIYTTLDNPGLTLVTFKYKGEIFNQSIYWDVEEPPVIPGDEYDKNKADFYIENSLLDAGEHLSGSLNLMTSNNVPIAGKRKDLTLTDSEGNPLPLGKTSFVERLHEPGYYSFTAITKTPFEAEVTFSLEGKPHDDFIEVTVYEKELPAKWYDNVHSTIEFIPESNEFVTTEDGVVYITNTTKGKFIAKLTDGSVEGAPVPGFANDLQLKDIATNSLSRFNTIKVVETEPGTYVWDGVVIDESFRETVGVSNKYLTYVEGIQLNAKFGSEWYIDRQKSILSFDKDMQEINVGDSFVGTLVLQDIGDPSYPVTGIAEHLRFTNNKWLTTVFQDLRFTESTETPGTYTTSGVMTEHYEAFVGVTYQNEEICEGVMVKTLSKPTIDLTKTTLEVVGGQVNMVDDFVIRATFYDTEGKELPSGIVQLSDYWLQPNVEIDYNWFDSGTSELAGGGKIDYTFNNSVDPSVLFTYFGRNDKWQDVELATLELIFGEEPAEETWDVYKSTISVKETKLEVETPFNIVVSLIDSEGKPYVEPPIGLQIVTTVKETGEPAGLVSANPVGSDEQGNHTFEVIAIEAGEYEFTFKDFEKSAQTKTSGVVTKPEPTYDPVKSTIFGKDEQGNRFEHLTYDIEETGRFPIYIELFNSDGERFANEETMVSIVGKDGSDGDFEVFDTKIEDGFYVVNLIPTKVVKDSYVSFVVHVGDNKVPTESHVLVSITKQERPEDYWDPTKSKISADKTVLTKIGKPFVITVKLRDKFDKSFTEEIPTLQVIGINVETKQKLNMSFTGTGEYGERYYTTSTDIVGTYEFTYEDRFLKGLDKETLNVIDPSVPGIYDPELSSLYAKDSEGKRITDLRVGLHASKFTLYGELLDTLKNPLPGLEKQILFFGFGGGMASYEIKEKEYKDGEYIFHCATLSTNDKFETGISVGTYPDDVKAKGTMTLEVFADEEIPVEETSLTVDPEEVDYPSSTLTFTAKLFDLDGNEIKGKDVYVGDWLSKTPEERFKLTESTEVPGTYIGTGSGFERGDQAVSLFIGDERQDQVGVMFKVYETLSVKDTTAEIVLPGSGYKPGVEGHLRATLKREDGQPNTGLKTLTAYHSEGDLGFIKTRKLIEVDPVNRPGVYEAEMLIENSGKSKITIGTNDFSSPDTYDVVVKFPRLDPPKSNLLVMNADNTRPPNSKHLYIMMATDRDGNKMINRTDFYLHDTLTGEEYPMPVLEGSELGFQYLCQVENQIPGKHVYNVMDAEGDTGGRFTVTFNDELFNSGLSFSIPEDTPSGTAVPVTITVVSKDDNGHPVTGYTSMKLKHLTGSLEGLNDVVMKETDVLGTYTADVIIDTTPGGTFKVATVTSPNTPAWIIKIDPPKVSDFDPTKTTYVTGDYWFDAKDQIYRDRDSYLDVSLFKEDGTPAIGLKDVKLFTDNADHAEMFAGAVIDQVDKGVYTFKMPVPLTKKIGEKLVFGVTTNNTVMDLNVNNLVGYIQEDPEYIFNYELSTMTASQEGSEPASGVVEIKPTQEVEVTVQLYNREGEKINNPIIEMEFIEFGKVPPIYGKNFRIEDGAYIMTFDGSQVNGKELAFRAKFGPSMKESGKQLTLKEGKPRGYFNKGYSTIVATNPGAYERYNKGDLVKLKVTLRDDDNKPVTGVADMITVIERGFHTHYFEGLKFLEDAEHPGVYLGERIAPQGGQCWLKATTDEGKEWITEKEYYMYVEDDYPVHFKFDFRNATGNDPFSYKQGNDVHLVVSLGTFNNFISRGYEEKVVIKKLDGTDSFITALKPESAQNGELVYKFKADTPLTETLAVFLDGKKIGEGRVEPTDPNVGKEYGPKTWTVAGVTPSADASRLYVLDKNGTELVGNTYYPGEEFIIYLEVKDEDFAFVDHEVPVDLKTIDAERTFDYEPGVFHPAEGAKTPYYTFKSIAKSPKLNFVYVEFDGERSRNLEVHVIPAVIPFDQDKSVFAIVEDANDLSVTKATLKVGDTAEAWVLLRDKDGKELPNQYKITFSGHSGGLEFGEVVHKDPGVSGPDRYVSVMTGKEKNDAREITATVVINDYVSFPLSKKIVVEVEGADPRGTFDPSKSKFTFTQTSKEGKSYFVPGDTAKLLATLVDSKDRPVIGIADLLVFNQTSSLGFTPLPFFEKVTWTEIEPGIYQAEEESVTYGTSHVGVSTDYSRVEAETDMMFYYPGPVKYDFRFIDPISKDPATYHLNKEMKVVVNMFTYDNFAAEGREEDIEIRLKDGKESVLTGLKGKKIWDGQTEFTFTPSSEFEEEIVVYLDGKELGSGRPEVTDPVVGHWATKINPAQIDPEASKFEVFDLSDTGVGLSELTLTPGDVFYPILTLTTVEGKPSKGEFPVKFVISNDEGGFTLSEPKLKDESEAIKAGYVSDGRAIKEQTVRTITAIVTTPEGEVVIKDTVSITVEKGSDFDPARTTVQVHLPDYPTVEETIYRDNKANIIVTLWNEDGTAATGLEDKLSLVSTNEDLKVAFASFGKPIAYQQGVYTFHSDKVDVKQDLGLFEFGVKTDLSETGFIYPLTVAEDPKYLFNDDLVSIYTVINQVEHVSGSFKVGESFAIKVVLADRDLMATTEQMDVKLFAVDNLQGFDYTLANYEDGVYLFDCIGMREHTPRKIFFSVQKDDIKKVGSSTIDIEIGARDQFFSEANSKFWIEPEQNKKLGETFRIYAELKDDAGVPLKNYTVQIRDKRLPEPEPDGLRRMMAFRAMNPDRTGFFNPAVPMIEDVEVGDGIYYYEGVADKVGEFEYEVFTPHQGTTHAPMLKIDQKFDSSKSDLYSLDNHGNRINTLEVMNSSKFKLTFDSNDVLGKPMIAGMGFTLKTSEETPFLKFDPKGVITATGAEFSIEVIDIPKNVKLYVEIIDLDGLDHKSNDFYLIAREVEPGFNQDLSDIKIKPKASGIAINDVGGFEVKLIDNNLKPIVGVADRLRLKSMDMDGETTVGDFGNIVPKETAEGIYFFSATFDTPYEEYVMFSLDGQNSIKTAFLYVEDPNDPLWFNPKLSTITVDKPSVLTDEEITVTLNIFRYRGMPLTDATGLELIVTDRDNEAKALKHSQVLLSNNEKGKFIFSLKVEEGANAIVGFRNKVSRGTDTREVLVTVPRPKDWFDKDKSTIAVSPSSEVIELGLSGSFTVTLKDDNNFPISGLEKDLVLYNHDGESTFGNLKAVESGPGNYVFSVTFDEELKENVSFKTKSVTSEKFVSVWVEESKPIDWFDPKLSTITVKPDTDIIDLDSDGSFTVTLLGKDKQPVVGLAAALRLYNPQGLSSFVAIVPEEIAPGIYLFKALFDKLTVEQVGFETSSTLSEDYVLVDVKDPYHTDWFDVNRSTIQVLPDGKIEVEDSRSVVVKLFDIKGRPRTNVKSLKLVALGGGRLVSQVSPYTESEPGVYQFVITSKVVGLDNLSFETTQVKSNKSVEVTYYFNKPLDAFDLTHSSITSCPRDVVKLGDYVVIEVRLMKDEDTVLTGIKNLRLYNYDGGDLRFMPVRAIEEAPGIYSFVVTPLTAGVERISFETDAAKSKKFITLTYEEDDNPGEATKLRYGWSVVCPGGVCGGAGGPTDHVAKYGDELQLSGKELQGLRASCNLKRAFFKPIE